MIGTAPGILLKKRAAFAALLSIIAGTILKPANARLPTSMSKYHQQPITHFVKINHIIYCAIAYQEKDVESFCRHFVMLMMDKRNVVSFELPVTTLIHQLTGFDQQVIKRSFQKMIARKELVRRGHKIVKFNPIMANKVKKYTNNLDYDGEDRLFSESELKMIEELNRLVRSRPKDTHFEDEEMSALLKKMQDMESRIEEMKEGMDRLLLIVETIAKGGSVSVDEAKRHLTLVKAAADE